MLRFAARIGAFAAVFFAFFAFRLPCPVQAARSNPRIGIDIDARLVTPELVAYISEFGFGYLRMKVFAEDILDSGHENADALVSVSRQCEASGMKLWLVLDSRTLKADTVRRACELIAGLPGGAPWAVQLLNDVNYRIGLPTDRYASLIRVADIALDLPEGHYLLLGGIKSCDLKYLEMLKSAGALDRVDAVTLNLFPPQDGIEYPTKVKIRPSSDIASAIAFAKTAAGMGKETWVGELGIANSITGYGVDAYTQAGLLPRAALILISQGISKVTMFTALDPPLAAAEGGGSLMYFGMIPADLHPRPWGWAMRNLNMLVGDMYPSWYGGAITWAPSFPAAGDAVFHVFYENERYLAVVFWTTEVSAVDRRTGLMIYEPGFRGVQCQNLLEVEPRSAKSNAAKNVVLIPDMPLSSVPTVLMLEKP
ncbi:MAG: hypothetical protein HRF49_11505 [bacterium]|jgi:hypothetical protein